MEREKVRILIKIKLRSIDSLLKSQKKEYTIQFKSIYFQLIFLKSEG